MIRSKVPNPAYRDNWDEIFKVKGLNEDHGRTEEVRERVHMIQTDLAPVKMPDGTVIKGRAHMRDYMKRNGYVHADDYKETWKKQGAERELMRTGQHPDQKRNRVEVLREAWEHNRNKSRYSKN